LGVRYGGVNSKRKAIVRDKLIKLPHLVKEMLLKEGFVLEMSQNTSQNIFGPLNITLSQPSLVDGLSTPDKKNMSATSSIAQSF